MVVVIRLERRSRSSYFSSRTRLARRRSMRRGVVTYAPEMDSDEGDDLTGADLP